MKIAYLGCDLFFQCFEKIYADGHEILKLFTFNSNEDYEENDLVTSSAAEKGIPIQYKRVTAEDLTFLFEKEGCELIVSAGYPYKIPVLNKPYFRGINIHPSFLPKGRGNWPLPYVILRGEEYTGVSVHKLEETFDTGDILLQTKIMVDKNETLDSLLYKCQINAVLLIGKILKEFDFYWENALPQGKGEYLPAVTRELLTINKRMSPEKINAVIRAAGKSGVFVDTGADEKKEK